LTFATHLPRKRPEANLVKAADMLIARRADTRARADFATWKMIAKLNGASSLPPEAQNFLASYRALLKDMPEAAASEATIILMYKSYYSEMGGVGAPPEIRTGPVEPARDNVTAFRRPPAARPKVVASRPSGKPQLPVVLIFACIVVVYVGIRYFWR
jgi:hypothetical protein